MDLQRLSIKLFAEPNSDVKQPEFVPIFHSWIQKQKIKDHHCFESSFAGS